MHDCLANTNYSFASAKEDFVMTFKANRDINKGEPITVYYGANVFLTTLQRQKEAALRFFVVIIF
jgi:hypothetical protein